MDLRSKSKSSANTPENLNPSIRMCRNRTPVYTDVDYLSTPSTKSPTTPKRKKRKTICTPIPVPPKSPKGTPITRKLKIRPCPVPCREKEFEKIWNFIKYNLEAKESSCIYVSGVPGTGKTLVVKAVISALDQLAIESTSSDFKHVYINGLSLGNPLKIWNRFYQSLIGKREIISSTKALSKLEKFFKGAHAPVILIVDELDQLLDRQQSILYRLLEWSSDNSAMLSFIAIFNTINLPEQALALKNVSRLGLDRVVFTAYQADQLKVILAHFLGNEKVESLGESLSIISRKVAAVSGDARRALEIAKRTLEIMSSKQISGIKAVQETLKELFSAPKIQALQCCSYLEQKILTVIAADCQSLGKDVTTLNRVVSTIRGNCLLESMPWSVGQIMCATTRLFSSKLLLLENEDPTMYRKVQLNVPIEDLNFAFQSNQCANSED